MKNIVVTGYPRSGTTALANLLNEDRRIFITTESHVFVGDSHINMRDQIYGWTTELMKKKKVKFKDFGYLTYRGLFAYFYDKDLFEWVGDKSNRPFLDNYDYCLGNMYKPLVLVSVRDMRDCLLSAKWNEKETLEERTEIIIRAYENIAEMIKIPMVHWFRYEDLVTDIEKTKERLSEVLGFKLKIKQHNYKPVNVGIWKESGVKFSPDLDETLTYFGYEI